MRGDSGREESSNEKRSRRGREVLTEEEEEESVCVILSNKWSVRPLPTVREEYTVVTRVSWILVIGLLLSSH